MQQFPRTFTAMLVATHAVLGCCAHHACGFDNAGGEATTVQAPERHDPADNCPHQPAHEEGERPAETCHHDTCSFVKCPPVRVDDGSGRVAWMDAELLAVAGRAEHAGPIIAAPSFFVAAPHAKLFVRYCALLL